LGICIYPGSFDPVTNGHLDIIERSAKMFDHLTVAVLNNFEKKPLFTLEEKLCFLNKSVKHLANVETDSFQGLLVDYMAQKKARVVIRGLRAISDFEHEFAMAAMNARLAPDIETIFMMTNTEYSFLSSSMIKDLVINGGTIRGMVPGSIEKDIVRIINERRGGMGI
jgi:pantetheine-phosphate adenylyltransferase